MSKASGELVFKFPENVAFRGPYWASATPPEIWISSGGGGAEGVWAGVRLCDVSEGATLFVEADIGLGALAGCARAF